MKLSEEQRRGIINTLVARILELEDLALNIRYYHMSDEALLKAADAWGVEIPEGTK